MSAIARLTLCLILVACAAKPLEVPGFRASDSPIYSIASLRADQVTGRWVQVATFAPQGRAPCGPGSVEIDATFQARWDLCLASGRVTGAGPMLTSVAGRYDLTGMPPWWVLWADTDGRTLVIGTPSGKIGFVLNREAAIPADRLRAARDILQFNQYDMTAFVAY